MGTTEYMTDIALHTRGPNPPTPKTFGSLPPEILDNVFECIELNIEGRKTLIECALVATWWTGPSQRRLFSSVLIDEENYQQWMDSVALPNPQSHVLRYVRSFSLGSDGETEFSMENLAMNSGGYLAALHNLRSLTLIDISIVPIGEEAFHTCFSAFRESLTELSLEFFSASFSMFVALVGYFPNVTTLRLELFALHPYEGPVPPLSRPLRGELYLRCTNSYWQEFVNRFSKLNLEYDRIVVDFGLLTVGAEALETSLQLNTSGLKCLRLEARLQPGTVATAISKFRQLQELELLVNWFGNIEGLLSSIASTELRKLVILGSPIVNRNIFIQGMEVWAPLDEQLCELVVRLGTAGYRHTLEVVLRPIESRDDDLRQREIDLTRVLPGFRKKGVVTTMDPFTDDPSVYVLVEQAFGSDLFSPFAG